MSTSTSSFRLWQSRAAATVVLSFAGACTTANSGRPLISANSSSCGANHLVAAAPAENPILAPLRGRIPIAHVARGPLPRVHTGDDAQPASSPTAQATWELAVFDDGTMVYEGRRCVETGGLSVKHLDDSAMQAVHALIAAECADFPNAKSDELCIEHGSTRIACADGEHVAKGSNRCTADDKERAKVDDFAEKLLAATEADLLVGADDSADGRQSCERGSPALAGMELRRVFPFEGEPAPAEPAERQASLQEPVDETTQP